MTKEQIETLLNRGMFPENERPHQLIETHISWVIICEKHVFKIKKPVKFSFLDFSTPEKRKYYCEKEVILNRRLAEELYLGVVFISEDKNKLVVSLEQRGKLIDYAVMMEKMDAGKRMDRLLFRGMLGKKDMENLANVLVDFHRKAPKTEGFDLKSIRKNFNDIMKETRFLEEVMGSECSVEIVKAVHASEMFLEEHKETIIKRAANGFVKDLHGDLHTENIFFTDKPVVYDCIEFNEELRKADILNELAFLCMDMEVKGQERLSGYFLAFYNGLYRVMETEEDYRIFIYFKAYRANVRAKVSALRAKESFGQDRENALRLCREYLRKMGDYI